MVTWRCLGVHSVCECPAFKVIHAQCGQVEHYKRSGTFKIEKSLPSKVHVGHKDKEELQKIKNNTHRMHIDELEDTIQRQLARSTSTYQTYGR